MSETASPVVPVRVNHVIERVVEVSSENTGDRYASALRVYGRWCNETDRDPIETDPLALDRYFRHLKEQDYAYSTVGVHKSALSSFFESAEYLAEMGRLDADVPAENPTEGTNLFDVFPDKADRRTKKERALDGTENRHALDSDTVDAIAESVPSPTVRNELFVRLTYQGMLRRGEAIRLKEGDIDRQERSITVRAEVAKNGESRKTYYMPSLDTLLDVWLDVDRDAYTRAAESDYVFVSEQNEHMSGWHASDVVKRAARAAGYQDTMYTDAQGKERAKIGVHTLRHSGAVRRWENEADLETLRRLLGHEDLSTTQEYLDVDPDDVAEKARKSWHRRED